AARGWLTLEGVLRAVDGTLASPAGTTFVAPRDLEFAGCAIDSRTLQAGDLFVPLPGTRADGHDFIAAALQGSAAGSLIGRDRPVPPEAAATKKPVIRVADPLGAMQALGRWCRDRAGIPVVAITGSNGKTTTKEMTAAVLGTSRRVHKNVGNLNNHIGVPLTLTRLRPEHEALVVEMGMSARGEIRDLAAMAQPTIGVLTNASAAHLQQLGSVEEVALAKSELAEALPTQGLLVLNADDPLLYPMNRERIVRKTTYGLDNPDAGLRPTRVLVDEDGTTRFTLDDGSEGRLSLLGRHNVRNALAAIAVGDELMVPRDAALAALAALRPAKHRLEILRAGGVAVIDDAYNANPASMREALSILGGVAAQGERRAVLGDMLELGPGSEALHEAVGRAVPAGAWLYVAGSFAPAIERGARAAGVAAARIRRFEDVDAMSAAVAADARAGDLVLVKGSRGMRLERVVQALQAAGAQAGAGRD
ncbi:MAG TPA: UDP-N-acetylmuramoyl-tripeptide--D-alanyl-D-alanine ligase, partial [Candidatus Omnitrophota bacterium]|nr:UDP-N-acetylmuramoyl-tripeptide--D-alanyl-D-alanine ligase [Candidatus Omnitrophota bacterium]